MIEGEQALTQLVLQHGRVLSVTVVEGDGDQQPHLIHQSEGPITSATPITSNQMPELNATLTARPRMVASIRCRSPLDECLFGWANPRNILTRFSSSDRPEARFA
jgi:hypothetical protein